MLLVGVSGIEDARRVERVLQLEQAAVGLMVHPAGGGLPGFLRRDERSPGRPVTRHRKRRGRLATGLCQIVSVRPVSRSWRCTPDWPVSNTVNRKRPLCGPVSFDGDHVPAAGVGHAGRQLGRAVGDGLLLKVRIAEGDRLASSAVGPAELVSGVKSEKRVPSAKRTVPASSRPPAVTSLARSSDILILTISSRDNRACARMKNLYRLGVASRTRTGDVRANSLRRSDDIPG